MLERVWGRLSVRGGRAEAPDLELDETTKGETDTVLVFRLLAAPL